MHRLWNIALLGSMAIMANCQGGSSAASDSAPAAGASAADVPAADAGASGTTGSTSSTGVNGTAGAPPVDYQRLRNAQLIVSYTLFDSLQCDAGQADQTGQSTSSQLPMTLPPIETQSHESCQQLTSSNIGLRSIGANFTTSDTGVVVYGCVISFWTDPNCQANPYGKYFASVAPGGCVPNVTFTNSSIWMSAGCDVVAAGSDELNYQPQPINPAWPPRVIPPPTNATIEDPSSSNSGDASGPQAQPAPKARTAPKAQPAR